MSACDKYQEMISALLDGELTEEEQTQVRAHIASCAECRAMYEAFSALNAAVSADVDVPESLHDGIMARVHSAETATKTQGKLTVLRRTVSLAACLVVIVGTVFALRNNLFPHRKAADAAPAEAEMMINASAAVAASGAEAPMLAMDEAVPEAAGFSVTEYGGEEMKSEEAPSATPVPEPASSQSGSAEGIPTWENGAVAEVRRIDEVMVLRDVDALQDALLPQETELRFDPGARASDCVVTLETGSGTERTLQVYFDGDHVWVEENGEVYLASCTPEEFDAIR